MECDVFTLGEYFEAWNDNVYSFDENNFLFLNEIKANRNPFNLHPDTNDRIKKLTDCNKNQNFVVRLFLMDNYDKNILKLIVDHLRDLGFEFIALQRSIEEQLLSYCIAYTNFYDHNNNTFVANSTIINKVFINIAKIEPTIEHIARSNKNFNSNLNIIFGEEITDVKHVNYESLAKDLGNIYDKKIEIMGNKTIEGSHLNYILNKEKTMQLIQKYYGAKNNDNRFTSQIVSFVI